MPLGDIPPEQHCNSATVAAYAALKQLPESFLRSLGLADIRHQGAPALRIPYRDRGGAETAVRIRRLLGDSRSCGPRFLWRRGDRPQLYGLERLGSPDHVVLVEGESDCHTLWHHGIPALGLPGAGTWNEEREGPHVDGIARVIVDELSVEDRLNEEAREVLAQHMTHMERSDITYSEMFKKVKRELAKKKGIVL